MADQENPNSIISISELSSQDHALLQQAASQGKAALEHAIGRLELEKHGQLPYELRQQLTETYLKQTEQSQQPPSLPSTGGILSTVGAAGLAAATQDTSGSRKIFGDINDTQINELLGENSPFRDALAQGDTKAIEENLKLLDPDNLLDDQYDKLKQHLTDGGADEKTLKQIDEQHTALKDKRVKERDDPKNSETQKKSNTLQDKRKTALLDQIKKVNDSALDNKTKIARRQALLHQYAREQQRKNTTHFDTLLSKKGGLLGFGRGSTLPTAAKKKILEKIDQRRKDEEAQRRNARLQERVTRRQAPPRLQQIPTGGGQATVPQTTPSPSSSPGISGIPGGGNLAIKGLAAIGWEPIAIAAGVILLLILFIVIVIILFGQTSSPLTPIQQVTCGKSEIAAIADTGTGIYKEIGQKFFVNFNPEAVKSPIDDRVTPSAIFSTICILFGHTDENIYQDFKYNSFGTLTTERNLYYSSGVKPKTITYVVLTNQKDHTTCDISYGNQKGDIIWYLTNPDLCVTPIDGGKGIASLRLQFLLAKSLAYSLILQQQYLSKGNNVFDSSFVPTGFLTSPGPLPTTSCQQTSDKTLSDGKTFAQEANCFSDMVGEYLTYPFYFDGIFPSILPSPTNTPSSFSPTPEGQRPIYTVNQSPLSDFSDDKNAWNAYYIFAKKNLFDGEDLFSTKTNIDNNAKLITDNLIPSTCTDGADGSDYNFFDQIKPSQSKPPSQLTTSSGYIVKGRGPDDSNRCTGVRFWCTHLIIDSFAMAGVKDLADSEIRDDLVSVENMKNFFRSDTNSLAFVPYFSFPQNDQEKSLESNLIRVKPGDAMFQESVRDYHNGKEHVMLVDKIDWVKDQQGNLTGDGTIYFYQSNAFDTYDHFSIHGWLIDTGKKTNDPNTTAWEITGFGTTAPTPGPVPVKPGTTY